jgi:serine/threonine-protein kinase
MGEVYRAEDTKLKRTVALKRVAPQFRSDSEHIQRIFKEAERASALNHPSVASVYDILESKPDVFLVMEYVEGKPLRERLRAGVPPAELISITMQCAQALQAAHEKGIVHGDVKPENIMLTPSGRVKLLDFGVARRMFAGPQASTTMGTTMGGTWGYMAPEVLLEKAVDGRSDLFSLGVILYEGLTGRHPFHTESLATTIERTLHKQPTPVALVNPNVSADLASVVDRLLEKEPHLRYATADELARDLHEIEQGLPPITSRIAPRLRLRLQGRTLIYALVLLAVLVAGALLRPLLRRAGGPLPLPENRYLAVLPFRAVAGSAGDQAYAEGLSAMLTSSLAKRSSRRLQVAPSSEIHAMHVSDARSARRVLGVNLVVDGSLYRSGDSLWVAYSIVDPASLQALRGEEVSAPAADLFALEQELRRSLSRSLELRNEPAGSPKPAAGTDAYQSYLRGAGYLQKETPESADSAIAAFKQALALDPTYVPARVDLGMAYLKKFGLTRQRTWLDQALSNCRGAAGPAAQEASARLCVGLALAEGGQYKEAVAELNESLRLDSSNDAAYSGLGQAYLALGDLSKAEHNFEHAVEVRPSYWAGYQELGSFYSRIGRYRQAAEQFEQAVSLAPELSTPYYKLGGVLLFAGNYLQAIEALRRGIDIAPDYRAYSNLGSAYLALQQYEAAIAAFEQAYRMSPVDYRTVGNLARAYHWAGKPDLAAQKYRDAIRLAGEALAVNPKDAYPCIALSGYHAMLGNQLQALQYLSRAQQLSRDDGELWFFAAMVHTRFGNQKQALRDIERSVALGYSRSDIRTSPELASLRNLPDFQALVRAE